MIRVETHPRLWREVRRAPTEIGQWTIGWVQAANHPRATLALVTEGAQPLKGADFRDCFVRKWRRKIPHGEYRLVFRATQDEVFFVSLEPRGHDYKTAQRRIRAMPH